MKFTVPMRRISRSPVLPIVCALFVVFLQFVPQVGAFPIVTSVVANGNGVTIDPAGVSPPGHLTGSIQYLNLNPVILSVNPGGIQNPFFGFTLENTTGVLWDGIPTTARTCAPQSQRLLRRSDRDGRGEWFLSDNGRRSKSVSRPIV